MVYRLFGRYAAGKVDGCNLFLTSSAMGEEALAVCQKRGIPAISHCGNSHVDDYAAWMSMAYRSAGLDSWRFPAGWVDRAKREYDLASVLTVESTFCGRSYVAVLPEERVFHAPLPISIHSEVRPEIGLGRPVRFVTTATIIRKGSLDLLKAWEQVAPLKSDHKLHLYGSLDQWTAREASRIANDRCLAHGKVTDLPGRLANADIFVMPTYEDGGPRALLEAMAAGCLPIATRNSIGPDVIENGVSGYLVDAGDVQALAELMRQCLHMPRPALLDMKLRAQKTALRKGSYEGYAARFAGLVNRLYPISKRARQAVPQ